MAQKRRKKKRRTPKSSGGGGPGPAPTGGGLMQGMRSGFKDIAGAGDDERRPSLFSNVLWGLVLLAALTFAVYRWTR